MKPLLKLIFISLLICPPAVFSLITGEDAIGKFRARMLGIHKLTGVFSLTEESGQLQTGSFKYLAPDKIYVKFTSPAGKVLVSNGKKLWVYNSGNNVCGVQDLAAQSVSGGIAGMVQGYNAIVSPRGSDGFTIKLKNNDKQYTDVVLRVDSSFMLKKAVFKNKDGKKFSFTLSNVSTTQEVMKNIFDYSVPTNAQVVQNPMNVR